METWKDIQGYEGLYQVSNFGAVRVLARKRNNRHGEIIYKGRILKPAKNKKGYLHVNFCKEQHQRSFYVHDLVATYFVEGKLAGLEVNHKDSDKSNNHFTNLEWGTHRHNIIHYYSSTKPQPNAK